MKHVIAGSCNYMQAQGWLVIYGYVIMPNHIHLIVQCQPEHPLMDVMRDFKKFTSKQIIAQLTTDGNDRALDYLRSAVRRPGKQAYAVWEDEYRAKDVTSPDFLWQKLEYIHNNPVQPRWHLVETPEEYGWSSARFYLSGQQTTVAVSDARQMV
jgi:putative transposase